MFCVRCGTEVGDATLVGGLCEACFLEENPLAGLPPNVDLERCVHCGARRRGETWVELGEPIEATVAAAVREAVDLDKRVRTAQTNVRLVAQDERNFTAYAEVSGTAEGVPFRREVETRARVKNATCLRCSRIQGGYYEAVIQVRASKRDVADDEKRRVRQIASRMIERIVADGDRNAFVLRDEEMHGGLDIVVGTIGAARMMAKAIAADAGATVTESPRLVGKKDGVDLYRVTFSVRLPEYGVGDAVVLDDKVYLVTSVAARKVSVRDPQTGRTETREREKVDKAAVLHRRDAKEAVVVSASDGELQVLDPWTYATVSVVKPAGMEAPPEAVPVLKWEDELVVLPP